METANTPVLLLALAIFLALGIERMIELVRAFFDHLEARRKNSDEDWNRKAVKIRDQVEARLEAARGLGRTVLQQVLFIACRFLSPTPGKSGALAIDAEYIRKATIRMRCKLLGVALGVGFAFAFQLDIFSLVSSHLRPKPLPPEWWGMLVTGIAMGFGAGPVHAAITALEKARDRRI